MDWGICVNFKKINKRDQDPVYTIDVLLLVDKKVDPSSDALLPPSSNDKGEMKVVTLALKNITQVSSARVFLPNDLRPVDNRQSVLKSINEIKKRFGKVPLLDPLEDMKIKDTDFLNLVKNIEKCEKRLQEFKNIDPQSAEKYEKKLKLEESMANLKIQMKKTRSLLQMDELKCRKRVLRRLGYCTSADVIEIKGRVACEISRYVLRSPYCKHILTFFLVVTNYFSRKCSFKAHLANWMFTKLLHFLAALFLRRKHSNSPS